MRANTSIICICGAVMSFIYMYCTYCNLNNVNITLNMINMHLQLYTYMHLPEQFEHSVTPHLMAVGRKCFPGS